MPDDIDAAAAWSGLWNAKMLERAQAVARSADAGEGRTHCEDCGEAIPEARRRAVTGVRRCHYCQEETETRFGH